MGGGSQPVHGDVRGLRLPHRHTNARAEAINSKIQQVKYQARGYRNRDNFRRAILFHCCGLQLNPL